MLDWQRQGEDDTDSNSECDGDDDAGEDKPADKKSCKGGEVQQGNGAQKTRKDAGKRRDRRRREDIPTNPRENTFALDDAKVKARECQSVASDGEDQEVHSRRVNVLIIYIRSYICVYLYIYLY